MNTINTEQILSQIRALNAELQSPAQIAPTPSDGPRFGDLLANTVNTVNDAQQASGQLKTAFESGSKDVSLVEVMVATQKADLSFRAMTEVRNKLVTAYQEIMNMPV